MASNDPYADLLVDEQDPYSSALAPIPPPPELPGRSFFDELLETGIGTIENAILPFRSVIEKGAGIDLPGVADIFSYGEKSTEPPSTPAQREPHGFVGKSLDILQRTQFFSAKFADELLDQGVAGAGNALIEAYGELVSPKERLRYADLIRKYAPEFAEANPFTTQLLGFGGDVNFDPLTYMDFLGGFIKMPLGAKSIMLNKRGLKALETQQVLALKTIENTRRVAEAALSGRLMKEDARFLDIALESIGKGDLAAADQAIDIISRQRFGNSLPAGVDLIDLTKHKLSKLELTPVNTARESAEKTLAKIYEAGARDIEARPGIYFKIPFGDYLKIPLSDKAFDAARTALKPLKEWAQENRIMQQIAMSQSRNHEIINGKLMPLHREVLDMRSDLFAHLDELDHEIPKTTWHLFRELKPDSRKKILDLAYKIDDASRLEEGRLGRKFTESEALQVRDRHIQTAMLDSKETATLSKFMNDQYRQGVAEAEAGLLDDVISNYNYRVYEKTRWYHKWLGAKQAAAKRPAGLSTYLGPSEAREYLTTADAEAAGLRLTNDAMKVYALRMLQGKRALARQQYKEGLKAFYGVDSVEKLSPQLQKDLAYIGDYNFSAMGSNEAWLGFVRAFDKVNQAFRFAAVPLRPYFAAKQLAAQNPLQSYLGNGVRAFKMFDPRVAAPAAALLWRHHGYVGEQMLPKLANIPLKMAQFTARTGLGKPYDMEELYTLAKQNGMFKQAVGISGDYERSIEKEMRDYQWDRWLALGNNAREGAVKVFREMSNFTNWGSFAEEYSNLSTWLNGIMLGHSAAGAAKVTNDVLFDYKHGLTETNRQIVRRFMRPFFSWERFATELLGKTFFKNPGRISNVNKLVQNFFEGWNKYHGGETLTDSERRVGDYMIEQPSAFEGFDENMKAVFRVFNSYSPLDIGHGMFVDSATKQLDIGKTMQRWLVAGGAPMWKIGLEEMMNKNFFTDRVIRKRPGAKIGQNITPDELLDSIATGAGFAGGPIPAMIASFGARLATSSDKAKDAIKIALSWEEIPDPVTGKNDVYINPWMAHVMLGMFPGLKSFIRLEDEAQTPRERVIELFTGIKTTKIDLGKSYNARMAKQEYAISELEREINRLRNMGAFNSAEVAQKELDELLRLIAEDRAQIDPYDIRK